SFARVSSPPSNTSRPVWRACARRTRASRPGRSSIPTTRWSRRARPTGGACPGSRSGRSTACRSGSRTSSTRPTCRPRTARGSTIRPASYCGIYGLKPTRGLIPRRGMSRVSQTLDTVGLFARTLEDVALLLESCVVHDEDEFESSPRAHTPYRAVAAEEAPIPPTFGFVKTPHWSRVDADAQEAFAELIERLGDRVEEVELAGAIERAWDWH